MAKSALAFQAKRRFTLNQYKTVSQPRPPARASFANTRCESQAFPRFPKLHPKTCSPQTFFLPVLCPNTAESKLAKPLSPLGVLRCLPTVHQRISVNNLCTRIRLPGERNLVGSHQFIERTETIGCRRKNDAGRFKDNPRRLGKGQVRLVGLAPRCVGPRGPQTWRQDSPVPLATVARRWKRESRNCAARDDQKPSRAG